MKLFLSNCPISLYNLVHKYSLIISTQLINILLNILLLILKIIHRQLKLKITN